ncbi:MAG: penicillin-binding protein 1A [Ahrensia sp.]
MENPFDSNGGNNGEKPNRRPSFLLDIDAWIDSQLYELRYGAGEFWESVVIFFRRFKPTGVSRGFFELSSEGFTLGTLGMVLLLGLAVPASEEIQGDWRAQDEFAITFLDRYGNEIGRRGILHSEAVPISELPDHLVKAVLATEDRRFFEHYGIDVFGLIRAMGENVRANSVVQGGSTITQQLAKNVFLSNERTIERKVKEVFLALWLEQNLSKEEILKLYLDRAYMGGGTFGVAAAAEFYFDKDVRSVSVAEAAMLAGLFKAPAKYAPHVNLPAARARANEVLTNMVQASFLTEGQVTGARREPADVVIRDDVDSPDYFLDWAFIEARKFVSERNIPNRTFVVRTTIDLDVQRASEEAVEFHLRQYGRDFDVSEGSAVVLENNGAVRALVGGRDYGKSQFNRATNALRQPGSSFKPYVYAAALETGLTPDSRVVDAPVTWRGWSPQNYNRGFRGRTTMADALARSINTVPVFLARDTLKGTGRIVELAAEMGVESEISRHHTTVLGTSGMTVMDQATGYLVFANGGLGNQRHAFTQILSNTGDIIYDRRQEEQSEGDRVLDSQVAAYMNQMLVNVTEWGTARRAALPGIKAAGKTGTTQAYRDAWFVGYTGNFTAAIWYGNDNYAPTNRLTGGRLPAETWQRIMSFAHQGIELKPLHGVDGSIETTPESQEQLVAAASGDAEGVVTIKPRVLSNDMSAYLRSLSQAFEAIRPASASRDELARSEANIATQ